MHVGVPLAVLDFKETGMSRGVLAKNSNIQFHENAYSISGVVTLRRTERKKGTKIQFT